MPPRISPMEKFVVQTTTSRSAIGRTNYVQACGAAARQALALRRLNNDSWAAATPYAVSPAYFVPYTRDSQLCSPGSTLRLPRLLRFCPPCSAAPAPSSLADAPSSACSPLSATSTSACGAARRDGRAADKGAGIHEIDKQLTRQPGLHRRFETSTAIVPDCRSHLASGNLVIQPPHRLEPWPSMVGRGTHMRNS